MAQETSSSNMLYFIVGGLVVIVGLGAFAYTGHFGGHGGGGGKTITEQTTTTTPSHHGEETTTTTTTEKTRP